VKKGEILRFIESLLANEHGNDCVLWPGGKNHRGYPSMRLGKKPNITAHRLICERAHGAPPTKKHHAAHSCGNKPCVNPQHLRWTTAKENIADKIVHDRVSKGQRNGSAKLTPTQVHSIRMLNGMLGVGHRKLARQFNVGKSTITEIANRKSWRDFA
jgi:hypothetical protein